MARPGDVATPAELMGLLHDAANLTAYPPGLDALVLTEPDAGMAGRLKRKVSCHRPDAQVLRVGAATLPFDAADSHPDRVPDRPAARR
jgi:hypothetical protein